MVRHPINFNPLCPGFFPSCARFRPNSCYPSTPNSFAGGGVRMKTKIHFNFASIFEDDQQHHFSKSLALGISS
jgi:hypothetical protein